MKNHGFPRNRRLAGQHEFRRLYRTGEKKANRYLTVYTSRVQGRLGKVGIVAGKRLGKAVERNRIRRNIRETVRTNQDRIGKDNDLVIVVKPPALELSRRELAEQLLQSLGKSEVLDA
jgi:ribonuclease P protein component